MTARFRSVLLSATLAATGALSAWGAAATEIVALSNDDELTRIDVEDARVIDSARLRGGARLLAIDVRPADGQLYGLLRDGRIVVINPETGTRTIGARIDFDFSNEFFSIDFNPVVDRLRIVDNRGTNLRANVDDGTFTVDADITGPNPNPFGDSRVRIVAIAYTNSFAGAVATQLYDIDRSPNAALYLQVPPNDGTLSPVGLLGRDVGPFGFDISVNDISTDDDDDDDDDDGDDDDDISGRNRGWIVSNNRLLEIDLAGGAIISGRQIDGLSQAVRDIAVLPEGDTQNGN